MSRSCSPCCVGCHQGQASPKQQHQLEIIKGEDFALPSSLRTSLPIAPGCHQPRSSPPGTSPTGGTFVQQRPRPSGAGPAAPARRGRWGRGARREQRWSLRHVHGGGRELPQAGEVRAGSWRPGVHAEGPQEGDRALLGRVGVRRKVRAWAGAEGQPGQGLASVGWGSGGGSGVSCSPQAF